MLTRWPLRSKYSIRAFALASAVLMPLAVAGERVTLSSSPMDTAAVASAYPLAFIRVPLVRLSFETG